jgi:uncharacterized protein YecE (DUF72 family)
MGIFELEAWILSAETQFRRLLEFLRDSPQFSRGELYLSHHCDHGFAEELDRRPAGFKFAVKAHQSITHFKRLRGAAKSTKEFFASLQPLRDSKKLGPVLFQLPPNFKCDLPLLRSFLTGLQRNVCAAFEFRHESWFNDDVYDLLRRSRVALCRAESDKLITPDVTTTNFSYLRLRKDRYPAKVRKELAKTARSLASRGDVFVYFKHEDAPDGALHAESLLKAI